MSDPWRTPTPSDPLSGYTSSPPPGASGMPSYSPHGQPGGAWVLAGWWSRAGAQIIDGIVISVMALVVLLVVGVIAGSGFLLGETAGIIGVVVGILIWGAAVTVAALVYAPLMMAKTNGKTLGRMATGIRVVRADGKRLDFGWAALREVVVKWLLIGTVANSVTFGLASLLDVLWPLWDEENRALHDFVVNTRVIRD
jgi:uncharacterized RDD family membrane protein YckC